MINYLNVEKMSAIFTGFFIDLNYNDKLKDLTFLEILLGFIYSYKKIIKSIDIVGILTQEQIEKISEVLNKAIEENIKIDENSNLYKLLKEVKEQKDE